MPDIPDDPLIAMLLAAQEAERENCEDDADDVLDAATSHAWLVSQIKHSERIALRFGHFDAARHLAAALDRLAIVPTDHRPQALHGRSALVLPFQTAP